MPKCAKAGYAVMGRVVTAVVLGLLVAVPAWAVHEESPEATKITSGTSHFVSSGRSWGTSVAFSSDQDLLGLGATRVPGRQIFVFDEFYYDCYHGLTKPTTPCPDPIPLPLQQVTNGPGNPDNPSMGERDSFGNQWIAFDADGSFNNLTGDSALHRQIFMKNLTTEEIRTVTFARNGDSVRPTVNSLALIVAFESTAQLAPGYPNPNGVPHVFLYDRSTRVMRQLGFGDAPSTNPNVAGLIVAFQSSSDLLNGGADTGISQIFYSQYDRQGRFAVTKQLTHGNGPSVRPWVADEGQEIAFESQATDLPGTLGGPGNQIYISTRVGEGATEPPTLQQVTWPARFGDCSFPVIRDGRNGSDRLGFICTGDPLDNLTTGNRAFVLDRQTATLYQITGLGDVAGPIHLNVGHWFMTLATTSDLAATGSCNYQIYVLDYYPGFWDAATQIGQLPQDAANPRPTSVIGTKTFAMLEGRPTGGSQVEITSLEGSWIGFIEDPRIPETGEIALVIGAPDEFTREASMRVPAVRVKIPPVPMPPESRFGAVCLTAADDGLGVIDCNGGRFGGDVVLEQDHDTSDFNPTCDEAPYCREDLPCKEPSPGPHRHDCGICVGAIPGTEDPFTPPVFGTCQGGLNPGLRCMVDQDCYGDAPCVNGTVATCNGPVVSNVVGTFAPGGALLTLPVHLSISLGPGVDGVYCNEDDSYSSAVNVPFQMRFTTGTTDASILDADALAGTTLAATETGAPFDCERLRAGDMEGARLVGVVPLLDVLFTPPLHDLLVRVRLEPEPPDADLCGAPCALNADCDDGNACNGVETCVVGQCAVGASVSCDDGDPCTVDICDAGTGACANNPCDDGDPCNGVETCSPTGCQPGAPVVCPQDGDLCNGTEACQPDGSCASGPPPNCVDTNPCTTDGCDPGTGCTNTPNTDPCDDGDQCTTGDVCGGGSCAGTAMVCVDPTGPCDGVTFCDPATGLCTDPPPGNPCEDGNPCTDNICNPDGSCQPPTNIAGPCNDNDACTTGDQCLNGSCTGTPITCDDGLFCNGVETCEPLSGCQTENVPDCTDGNPCTSDVCDENADACTNPPLDAVPCDDGNVCTTSDTCVTGTCIGTAVVVPTPCDDGSLCTTADTCVAGECVGTPTPAALACSDGNACNGVETCNPATGSCQPSSAPNCNDSNPCTDDSCIALTGCTNLPNIDPCDDGNACTTGDICAIGLCNGIPTICTNNNICDGVETCDPVNGTCQMGTPLTCDDGEPCNEDMCDPIVGCLHTPPDIFCQLTLLVTTIQEAAPRQLGGAARQRRFEQRARKARARVEAALRRNPLKATRNFRIAQKLLDGLRRKIERGMQSGKIERNIGTKIIGIAGVANQMVGGLVSGRARSTQ